MRWPDGVKCLSCESLRITRITAKGKKNRKTGKRGPDRELYQCNECRFQFTATTGTVYHDTHLPLAKWFLAIALITESKKGISANQLARALGVQYRTAWYLAHRIRKAMIDANPPKLSGIVEIDETYIGGKQRGHRSKLKNKDMYAAVLISHALAAVEKLPRQKKCKGKHSETSGPYQHVANADNRYPFPAPNFIAVAEVLKLCPCR